MIILLALLMAFVACGQYQEPDDPDDTKSEEQAPAEPDDELEPAPDLQAHNEARASKGIGPLQWSSEIATVAKA